MNSLISSVSHYFVYHSLFRLQFIEEMVRAGAIGKRVVDELTEMGCDIQKGCPNNKEAARAFNGRTLSDYYTEGKLPHRKEPRARVLMHPSNT